MPDQNNPAQNPTPVTPPTDAPVAPPVTPIIPQQTDLPPFTPAFQNLPEEGKPDTGKDSGSAAPPDISSVIPKAKKKFGGGKIIATILGLFLLIGGVGAGIVLTQQQQLFQQKASILLPCVSEAGGQCFPSSNICTGTLVANTDCPVNQKCYVGGTCTAPAPVIPVTPVTIADNNCLTSGQSCTSGKSYHDQTCSTGVRCGVQAGPVTPVTIADNNCLTSGLSCTSGKSFPDQTCSTGVRCGTKAAPAPTTIADGQCIEPGENCTSGKNYFDVSCPVTETRCGTKPGTPTIADGKCLGSGETCTSGNHYIDSSCSPINVRCGIKPSGGQCTRITTAYENQSANTGITIKQAYADACADACPAGTTDTPHLYASKFKCDGINLASGCQDNGQIISVPAVGQSIPVETPTCGTVQYDVGCKNSANTWGNLAFSTKAAATACSSATTPPTAPSCIAIKAYDDAWTVLTNTQLSALVPGNIVNFCVSGATGAFDRAQFMINTTLEPETTTPRPSSSDFCQPYTILSTDTTVNVKAKIHSTTSG
jgi:hypothetical protein